MNENDNSLAIRQQIVEKTTAAKHILLTIPKNPSVDEMSAAIGMSLLLDKLDKRPSIVFSGSIPPAVKFLEPDKLITQDIDGLRDFIIALSKDKADKLRWKLEDDVVKIYITPYKSALSQADLEFQQGEFNVELVIALGVENDNELDEALQAQGKVLHDATIISMTAGDTTSSIGSINWQDKTASSICEMLVTITEAFGSNLLDEPIATAFLTGIVAKTNRFSNELTTPKLMTMSAQLMSAGANQQLIATNLGTPAEINEGEEADIKNAPNLPSDKKEPRDDAEEMDVDHEESKDESNKSDKPPIEIPKNSDGEQINSDDTKQESEKIPDDNMINKASDNTTIVQDAESTTDRESQVDRSNSPSLSETNSHNDVQLTDKLSNNTDNTQAESNVLEASDAGIESRNNDTSSDIQSKEGDASSIVDRGVTSRQITEPPEHGGALNYTNSQNPTNSSEETNSSKDNELMGMTKGVDPYTQTETISSPGIVKDIYADISSDVEALVPPGLSQNISEATANPVDAARQAVLDASHTVSGPSQFNEENIHPSVSGLASDESAQNLAPVPSGSIMQPSNLDAMSVPPIAPPPLPPLPDDINMPLPPLPPISPMPPSVGMTASPIPAPSMPPTGEYLGSLPQQDSSPSNIVNYTDSSVQTNIQAPVTPSDPGTFPLPPMQ